MVNAAWGKPGSAPVVPAPFSKSTLTCGSAS